MLGSKKERKTFGPPFNIQLMGDHSNRAGVEEELINSVEEELIYRKLYIKLLDFVVTFFTIAVAFILIVLLISATSVLFSTILGMRINRRRLIILI